MSQKTVIEAVEKVYKELDEHLNQVAQKSGLKCPAHCNACCNKTDIEASPAEFLPLAAYLYKNNLVDEYLERFDNAANGLCVNYIPNAHLNGQWGCSQYEHRGLICRLFGYGFRLNRDGAPGLVTCKIMKSAIPEAVAAASLISLAAPDEMPIFRNYFMQLYAIEPEMAIKQLHINEAIRMAIEILYFHFAHLREEDELEVSESF